MLRQLGTWLLTLAMVSGDQHGGFFDSSSFGGESHGADSGAPPAAALSFAPQFDDYAVLQQKSGGEAWVYGTSTGTTTVTVKVSGSGCASLIVPA